MRRRRSLVFFGRVVSYTRTLTEPMPPALAAALCGRVNNRRWGRWPALSLFCLGFQVAHPGMSAQFVAVRPGRKRYALRVYGGYDFNETWPRKKVRG